MAIRTFRVMLTNKTEFPLKKLEDHLDHGEWTHPWYPPDTIAPGQTLGWQSESGGDIPIVGNIATGTEGWVKYRIEGGHGDELFLHWQNPFIGRVRFNVTLKETFNGTPSKDFTVFNTDDWLAGRPIHLFTSPETVFLNLTSQDNPTAHITVGPIPKAEGPLTASPVRRPSKAHSGSFIQSTYGQRGNFEMIVAEGDRLVHYWRDNDAPGYPWHRGAELPRPAGGSSGRLATIPMVPGGASLIQSNYGSPGNYEVIARTTPVIDPNQGGGRLVFYYFDSATMQWNGPWPVVADGQPVTGVTADPALIQGSYGQQGNFEMIVSHGNRLVHYWRDNDAPGYPWHRGAELPMPAGGSSGATATIPMVPEGAALIQSNFGDPGNFEVVSRISPVTNPNDAGGRIVFHYYDSAARKWNGPFPIVADGKPVTGVTGDPALIQSTYGQQGNFEMIVPQGDDLVHYWRENDAPGYPWHRGATLPRPQAGGSAGPVAVLARRPVDAAIIQSTFGSPGNLEVVARMVPITAGSSEAGHLVFYYFDGAWHGPFPMTADGRPITGVTAL
jgi:hypothetical protein